jgi:hypothetical protein
MKYRNSCATKKDIFYGSLMFFFLFRALAESFETQRFHGKEIWDTLLLSDKRLYRKRDVTHN